MFHTANLFGLIIRVYCVAVSHGCAPPENVPRPLVHPYSCSENHYVLCGVNPTCLPIIGTTLLYLMLFNQQWVVWWSIPSIQ